jgi:hypothetical protein
MSDIFNPSVSTVKSATDTTTLSQDIAAIAERIRGPVLIECTQQIRLAYAEGGKSAADPVKKQLPGAMFAGVFRQRGMTHMTAASGMLVADLDHLPPERLSELRQIIVADPSVVLMFTSPTGSGLKVVVRTGVAECSEASHLRAFKAVQRWMREKFGAEMDESGKDRARLCFLCHDPDVCYNPNAVPMDLDIWEEPAPTVAIELGQRQATGAGVGERARHYLATIPAAISGQGGHAAAYTAATVLVHGFELSEDIALSLLESEYNPRCSPSWTTDELRHKVRDAATKPHDRPRGWLLNGQCNGSNRVRKSAAIVDDSQPALSKIGDTEASLAEFLAAGSLNRQLRWQSGGPSPGWHVWDGQCWMATADRIPLPLQVAIRHAVADGLSAHSIEPKAISRLETSGGMRGIGILLSAHPSMRLPAETDPPGLLAIPSGVVDLLTGEKLTHDPTRPITRVCPVEPGLTSDHWTMIERHLAVCLGLLYPAVHRFLGSCLLGRGADRRVLWLCGPGNDGKSTLAKVLRAALGNLMAVVPAEVFGDGARGAHLHELGASMAGARLSVALEVGSRLDWPKLKGLSGGDEQRTKRLHGRSFAYGCPPCVLLIANAEPKPPDRASAERLILAKLEPPNDPDERIMAALKDGGPECERMASACLAWLLRGCAEFLAEGLGPVPAAGFESEGLARWWDRGTSEGWLLPGRGWSQLGAIMAKVKAYQQARGEDAFHEREVSAFLKTKVDFKRSSDGRRYRMTHGDA